jgi:hypothetical protein
MEMAKSSKSSFDNSNEQQSEQKTKKAKDNYSENYPGPINNQEQLKMLTITNGSRYEEFLPLIDDVFDNRYLKAPTDIQEEVHYRLVPDSVFSYLYDIYGGTDIRRFSIDLDTESDIKNQSMSTAATVQEGPSSAEQVQDSSDATPLPKKEYVVELQLRKVKIYVIPRIAYYPSASNAIDLPFSVYTSRKTTIAELQMKIAASLQQKSTKNNNKATPTLSDLCNWSRIMKVNDSQESIAGYNTQVYATNGNEE